ncbi:calcium-binding protein [Yoonia sp. 2307UL14-13]|uniref:calcium-binding protein n=1 Tax=Yoonia sp. 2307UL14-13 TaxID=3126506 RepID=UPI0030A65EC0
MDLTLLLLIGLGAALIIPNLGGDDDDDDGPERNEIRGTLGDDPELNGTDGDDLIRGFAGDDVIDAGAGVDEVRAGEGEDVVNGGPDRDEIFGGPGDDILNGDGGNDTIRGGGGNDTIDGGEGFDIVFGGAGDDVIYGDVGDATLRGEDDDDDVFLWGEEGRAFGGDGDDELVMVTGRGLLDGVAGSNTYYALANDDDEQQTVAIIRELGLDDEIVMTIDTSDASAEDADLLVTVTEGTINGEDGYNIEVAFANEADEPGDGETFETARAFVLGRSLDIETVVEAVRVDVTVNAGLSVEDAQTTFDNVKAGAVVPAVTDPELT